MRYLLLLCVCVLFNPGIHAQNQLFHDTTDFSQGWPAYFQQDTSQPNNLWQIGSPSKLEFDSAWSAPNALMTDTLNLFPPGNISSFTIQLNTDTINPWMCIGHGFMRFKHRYSFDSLHAGGYIEVRYFDEFAMAWTPWTNLAKDSLPNHSAIDQGEYPVDTITGGIPAYTGSSYGWKDADFFWIWMMMVKSGDKSVYTKYIEFRFTALSDSSAMPSEGWMIDDLEIILFHCMGSIGELTSQQFVSRAAPNPGSGDIMILIDTPEMESYQLKVYNREGMLMEESTFHQGEPVLIRSTQYPSGFYLYKLVTASGKVSEGKFVKI
jgi:hypothetical protein